MSKHKEKQIYEKNSMISALAIDSHAHLDRDLDLTRIVRNMEADGLKKIVMMAGDIKTAKWASAVSSENKNLFFMVGLHPYEIDQYNNEFVEFLTELKKTNSK